MENVMCVSLAATKEMIVDAAVMDILSDPGGHFLAFKVEQRPALKAFLAE